MELRFHPLARSLFLSAATLLAAVLAGPAWAQNNLPDSPFSGVMVDADGVLQRQMVPDPNGEVTRARVQSALAQLEGDLASPSDLRKVSLTRLERAIADKLAVGSGPDLAMKHLAGLTRIEYVFCYPATGDIVVAGPAEPWAEDPAGRVRGIETGRPVIELQDLITALRAFPPQSGGDSPLLYCSIDPTQEGLQRLQETLQQLGRRATPGNTQFIVDELQRAMGSQVITIGGVPATTHFAQVMVEADYRMKLIGINLERPPVRLTSYVDRAKPASLARNAMERWYFVPDYECVRVADDAMAMQIVGEGVKLVGEAEVITAAGGRQVSGGVNRASQNFTAAFTKMYPDLAEKSPVYAQLRNCIDMAVAAAFIQHNDLYSQVGWAMELFGDESKYPVETYNPPEEVATAVNAIWKGHTLMTPIGGGVQMKPAEALDSQNLLADEEGAVAQQREAQDLSNLAEGQWWWD